jgi:hypothetical protein
LEESGCGLIWDTIPASAWKNLEKPRNPSVRIADVPAQIKTEPTPNESEEPYLCGSTCWLKAYWEMKKLLEVCGHLQATTI